MEDFGEKASEEEEAPVGLILAVIGIPAAIVWLFWTNYYIQYMESYTLTINLLVVFLPQALPYIESSLFLTMYLVIQLVMYNASKELTILLWYGGLVTVAIMFGILDVLQIAMRNVGGRPVLSVILGVLGIALTVLMFLGPQIAFYTFLARIPLYAASAILIRG
ncbi:MAG: hypothetical protein Q6352_014145 [Candidatus Freyrarchaeum guaymaensis]